MPAIDATNIAHWWPLLLASVLSVSIGLSLGGVLCWMLSLPRDLYGIVLACTALGNMGESQRPDTDCRCPICLFALCNNS